MPGWPRRLAKAVANWGRTSTSPKVQNQAAVESAEVPSFTILSHIAVTQNGTSELSLNCCSCAAFYCTAVCWRLGQGCSVFLFLPRKLTAQMVIMDLFSIILHEASFRLYLGSNRCNQGAFPIACGSGLVLHREFLWLQYSFAMGLQISYADLLTDCSAFCCCTTGNFFTGSTRSAKALIAAFDLAGMILYDIGTMLYGCNCWEDRQAVIISVFLTNPVLTWTRHCILHGLHQSKILCIRIRAMIPHSSAYHSAVALKISQESETICDNVDIGKCCQQSKHLAFNTSSHQLLHISVAAC